MIKRKAYHSIKPYLKGREAVIITGMRQVGKTTLLQQLYEEVKSENKLVLDLENPLNRRYFEISDYEGIVHMISELGIDRSKKVYLFLDEIQYVQQIPSVVKYLIDHYGWKCFLTGSASFYLKNLFSESLAGRKVLFELFPLDFEEFLEMKGVKGSPNKRRQAAKPSYDLWQKWYAEYVEWGAFPGVVLQSSNAKKKKALEELFASYFNKEVIQLGDFRNNQKLRDLILLLLERVGSKLDIQRLSQELGISRVTVKEYLAFLEGTYFFTLVYPWTKNRDVEIRSTPKVYACDSGLVSQLSRVQLGNVFENTIFHQLRAHGKIQYYQKKTGQEIDFILNGQYPYEVKLHAQQQDVVRLGSMTKSLRLKSPRVVSYRHSSAPEVMYGFQL